MANQEHVTLLRQGVEQWNKWRDQHPEIRVNLSDADLTGFDLNEANLRGSDLRRANLSEANLWKANFGIADLRHANLSGANLNSVYIYRANLSGANLSGAQLRRAVLVETNLKGATLTSCSVYGISVWNVALEGAKQDDLVITRQDEPSITVDNLKIAQFIYLMLNNREIREVIDTVAKKAVLILGRFTPERKAVLDAIREALRVQGRYLPILFDFDKPSSRNFTETVKTLAHLSRFIIADLTDPSSIPQELQAIIPTLAIPVQPVLLEEKRAYAMFVDFLKTYHWVLPIHYYRDHSSLLTSLQAKVIAPAECKAQELEKQK
ncbi:MAG TPA: pentapeptide repeat-containing protein [Ktedonobacteraceae bacterium]|jgi:hypothetical protein